MSAPTRLGATAQEHLPRGALAFRIAHAAVAGAFLLSVGYAIGVEQHVDPLITAANH